MKDKLLISTMAEWERQKEMSKQWLNNKNSLDIEGEQKKCVKNWWQLIQRTNQTIERPINVYTTALLFSTTLHRCVPVYSLSMPKHSMFLWKGPLFFLVLFSRSSLLIVVFKNEWPVYQKKRTHIDSSIRTLRSFSLSLSLWWKPDDGRFVNNTSPMKMCHPTTSFTKRSRVSSTRLSDTLPTNSGKRLFIFKVDCKSFKLASWPKDDQSATVFCKKKRGIVTMVTEKVKFN